MLKKSIMILTLLLLWQASAAWAAEIIVVTENIDQDMDRLADDQELVDWLVAEGHSVQVRRNNWMILDSDKIDELNAADLIIVSRLTDSAYYDDGDEKTQWNSLTAPLLQMNAYFARNSRWEWVNYWNATNDTPAIYLKAVRPSHPIFSDVLTAVMGAGSPYPPPKLGIVKMIDPNVASGITSFIDTTDMGNGRLIAKPAAFEMGWIAEWDIGVEFFEGAGQYTGGRRMLFCAGTQEIQLINPDTLETMTTAYGELNLTAEGLQIFRNAINYLLLPEPTLELEPEP